MALIARRDDNDAPAPPAKSASGKAPAGPETAAGLASRLAAWAGAALIVAALAILAARSDRGSERIAQLFSGERPAARVAAAPPERREVSEPLILYETRRLADAVRVLSAERDALADRIAQVERGFGDVTASISREPARTAPRVIEARPPAAAPAADTMASPHDSLVIRTEFGVDLGGEATLEALRSRWSLLRSQNAQMLDGLRPIAAIPDGEGARGGELRLVAGPLANVQAATRLCAQIAAAGVGCRPTVFDGQRLAVR